MKDPTPTAASARKVDVIIPVHGAGAAFRRCVQSLLRCTDRARHRLLVVLDGPQEPEVQEVAARLAGTPGAEVVEKPSREGFVATANRGLRLSSRDVVLLNSDTIVTEGWVDKLASAAYSSRSIGTVTPFSNHATICSLPVFLAENTVPAGYDVDSFAALVEERSARIYPDLPTGVGVCLFVKREVLDAVGLLDESTFGLGYGEETELCLRATKAGYRHVLDDATYIFHEGQRSFGTSRRRRVARAHRVLRRRHPSYLPEVARFIREDPLAPLRERVTSAISSPICSGGARSDKAPIRRIVHVVHGWPPWAYGGTELYARWLARRQSEDRQVAVYARLGDPDRLLGEAVEHLDHGVRVRLAVNNFEQRNPLSRNALYSSMLAADFARFLEEERPELVHVHHLAGHATNLLDVARRAGVPVVVQLQDWWFLCARVNLFHRDGFLCSGPGALKCARCLPMTRLPGHRAWNPVLYAARAAWHRALLGRAHALVMGSRFVEQSFRNLGYLPPHVPVHVVPYGIERSDGEGVHSRSRESATPLRFGCIGALMPHKGQEVAVRAFHGVDPDLATLDVWGSSGGDPVYHRRLQELAENAPGVRLRGRFEEGQRRRIFEEIDVLIVPSLGLESFGIVAREAVAAGVPVIASDRGALSEFVASTDVGWLVAPGDTEGLRRLVLDLSDQPERVRQRSKGLPEVKDMARHVSEIDAIYAGLVPSAGEP